MEHTLENQLIRILEAELVKALGCTEPIAIAYASASARKHLGALPDKVTIFCSGNIIKNAKAVVVPRTDGMRGIEAAAAVGAAGGDPEKGLEVLTAVTEEDLGTAKRMLREKVCRAELLETREKLHIVIIMKHESDEVRLELVRTHLGIVKIEKNGRTVFEEELKEEEEQTDYSCLSMDAIFEFTKQVDIKKIKGMITEQIKCNTDIALAGLSGGYGAQIGKTLLQVYGDDVKVRAKAVAAAGSDARMNGCELPVVINSGSGNQGMTVSLPVIEYAKTLRSSGEELIRALVLSNLIAIYQKYRMGRLSAYCGAVSAAAGAGAGITYLMGGNREQIEHTVINTLGNTSGIVCDGASASCAAKIASSVDAAIMASYLSMNGHVFLPGEGIVKENIQKTVDGVVTLARDGMRETDEVILNIMVSDCGEQRI
ncbi:L-serine ammonia-lyase, iron-sulfur-dependent, subunit alpha [Lachnospiraceae bacterium 54-53]